MPHVDVAHLHEQGQDMILVALDRTFANKTDQDKSSTLDELQIRANGAGLRGSVALLWPGGFMGPSPWHPFLRSLPLATVMRYLNRRISW
jgi:hypothetical protein